MVLNVGAMHDGGNHQPDCVDDQMPLAAADLLTGIVAAWTPASVVFTDWLSTMPAEGLASRPSNSRACSTKSMVDAMHVPSPRQR